MRTDVGEEAVDHLINIDMTGRGVIPYLYKAAFKDAKGCLTKLVADRIDKALHSSEGYTIISTGFSVNPERVSETDGPVGASVLARGLDKAYNSKSVVVIEKKFFEPIKACIRAAGLLAVDNIEDLKRSRHAACILDLSIEENAARQEAKRIFDEVDPSVLVAIERCGWNEKGIYHNMRGFDITQWTAKADILVRKLKIERCLQSALEMVVTRSAWVA